MFRWWMIFKEKRGFLHVKMTSDISISAYIFLDNASGKLKPRNKKALTRKRRYFQDTDINTYSIEFLKWTYPPRPVRYLYLCICSWLHSSIEPGQTKQMRRAMIWLNTGKGILFFSRNFSPYKVIIEHAYIASFLKLQETCRQP